MRAYMFTEYKDFDYKETISTKVIVAAKEKRWEVMKLSGYPVEMKECEVEFVD